MLLLAIAICACSAAQAQRGYGDDDPVTRWQIEQGHNRAQDRENELLDKESGLKREIFELDNAITVYVQRQKNDREDLRRVQQELLAIKMQRL